MDLAIDDFTNNALTKTKNNEVIYIYEKIESF
jgi:hypothetical protein